MALREAVGYIQEWAERQFPQQGVDAARSKFLEELWEFIPELDEAELADVFITFVTYVGKLYTLDRFEQIVAEKMAVNEARDWEIREDGTGQHRD